MFDKSLTEQVNKWLFEWFDSEPNSYFITVRFPINLMTPDFITAERRLKNVMKTFERCLFGRYWNKRHWEFVGTAESGKYGIWHFHLLMRDNRQPNAEQLDNAIEATRRSCGLDCYSFFIEPIMPEHQALNNYIVKELKVYPYQRFDPDRIVSSFALFDLPQKRLPQ